MIPPDPVIEEYKRDVDRTLIQENLKLTPEQRLWKLMKLQRFAAELRTADRERGISAVTEIEEVVEALSRGGVRFIIVGLAAGMIHGSDRLTECLDVVYDRDPENLTRLVDALAPYEPRPRGAPRRLPFPWRSETLRIGLNFALTSTLGAVNLLGEVAGGGTYSQLLPETIKVRILSDECLCVGLNRLMLLSRTAGRPKDMDMIADLEALSYP